MNCFILFFITMRMMAWMITIMNPVLVNKFSFSPPLSPRASDFCADQMHVHLGTALSTRLPKAEATQASRLDAIAKAFKDAFEGADVAFLTKAWSNRWLDGSTAVAAYVSEGVHLFASSFFFFILHANKQNSTHVHTFLYYTCLDRIQLLMLPIFLLLLLLHLFFGCR
jgi:hypothetical protein